jgi:glutamate-1-semialdehyde 2,1-aminomutase
MLAADTAWIDLEHIWSLNEREQQAFVATHPRSIELTERARASMPLGVPTTWFELNYDHPPLWIAEGKGSRIRDVDGHDYVDFLLGIALTFCGHAPEPVVAAIADRASRGSMFQLPTEDFLWVAEELSRRYVPLRWQFALSSSQSNLDCIRLARVVTDRPVVVKFDANYHGHVDPLLVIAGDPAPEPEYHGVAPASYADTRVIPFNDVHALEEALAPRDVALVIAEPAMTNVGFIEPEPGYHEDLRRITRETDTLLLIDETQTFMSAYGGLTNEYGLEPDLFILGKSLGGGIVPVSAYGLNEEVAARIEQPHAPFQVSGEAVDEVALGGTMWGYAVGAAAARAALAEVLTEEAFQRTRTLGAELADGLESVIRKADLPWAIQRLGTRAAYVMSSELPRNGDEARRLDVPGFRDAQRLFMLNRGIWDFGWWGGPSLSVAHTRADVDAYLESFAAFLDAIR